MDISILQSYSNCPLSGPLVLEDFHMIWGGCLYKNTFPINCEAQARVRQGSARDGSQGERPQSLNPRLELTLKLVATHHRTFNFTD